MSNRVVLGKAKTTSGGSDIYGLWVSKPGTDVINTSNSVLADPEDMLFDSRRAEMVSQPLASGTGTVTFTSSGATMINTDSGFINYGTTYDYRPILMYTFVDSGNNRVYPMYYENSWTNTITWNPGGEPVFSTSSGYFGQSNANIYTDKFKIFAHRYIRQNGTIDGFSTGTHTFYWAIFPVGEAVVE
mgnify:CR=1 FL=1